MIEIKKAIKLFEAALPFYENALSKDRINYNEICRLYLEKGLCACLVLNNSHYEYNLIFSVFAPDGYYKNYLTNRYLCKTPSEIYINAWAVRCDDETEIYHPSLKFRRDFLKTEIKELTQLMKNGYTHI